MASHLPGYPAIRQKVPEFGVDHARLISKIQHDARRALRQEITPKTHFRKVLSVEHAGFLARHSPPDPLGFQRRLTVFKSNQQTASL
jgi:hypothetical protein